MGVIATHSNPKLFKPPPPFWQNHKNRVSKSILLKRKSRWRLNEVNHESGTSWMAGWLDRWIGGWLHGWLGWFVVHPWDSGGKNRENEDTSWPRTLVTMCTKGDISTIKKKKKQSRGESNGTVIDFWCFRKILLPKQQCFSGPCWRFKKLQLQVKNQHLPMGESFINRSFIPKNHEEIRWLEDRLKRKTMVSRSVEKFWEVCWNDMTWTKGKKKRWWPLQ